MSYKETNRPREAAPLELHEKDVIIKVRADILHPAVMADKSPFTLKHH